MSQSGLILNKLISQIAKDQHFVNYDVKIEPISSGGANFTSTLHNITIAEGDKCLHMFAKVAAIGEAMRTQTPKFYQTESFFYTKILKLYEQLQDDHQVPQKHRLALPKFYGCNTEVYQETIVLENLIIKGYQAYNRFKSVDWEYAKSAMTEVAKLHASAFAYGEYYPEEYTKLVDDLKQEFDLNSDMMSDFLKHYKEKAVYSVREENRRKLQDFFDSFKNETFREYFTWTRRPVLGHGDFRPSNLMHRIRKVSLFTCIKFLSNIKSTMIN